MGYDAVADDEGCGDVGREGGNGAAAGRAPKRRAPRREPTEKDPLQREQRDAKEPLPREGTGPGLFFTSCVKATCPLDVEEALDANSSRDRDPNRPVDANSDDEYVTRTFRWKPEDFPLEIATYMQCEEPWEPELPMQRKGEVQPVGGKNRLSCRIAQLEADSAPEEMAEDGAADDILAEHPGGASSPADSRWPDSPAPAAAPAAEESWTADWSLLEAPEATADGGAGAQEGGGKGQDATGWPRSPACERPAEQQQPPPAEADLGTVEDELRLLRRQVEALRRENEVLRHGTAECVH